MTHDLTPVTTVAAVTTLQQVAALQQADPTAKHNDLQAVADDLAQKRAASTAPLPDLTDPASVASDASALKQASAPEGSYAGTATTTAVAANSNQKLGGTQHLAALIDGTGKFLVVAMHDPSQKSPQNDNNNGNNTNGNNPNSNGNGGDSHGNNDGKDGNFATGTVTADGVVTAITKDGSVKVTGLFTAGVGSGTWQRTDGSAGGTWTLTLLKQPYSGLYSGKYASNTDGGGKGDFAILVLDDNTLFISGAGYNNQGGPISGTGSANSTGAITFQVTDATGTTVTGSGQIDLTNHSLSGTWTSTSGETGTFTGRANHADNADL